MLDLKKTTLIHLLRQKDTAFLFSLSCLELRFFRSTYLKITYRLCPRHLNCHSVESRNSPKWYLDQTTGWRLLSLLLSIFKDYFILGSYKASLSHYVVLPTPNGSLYTKAENIAILLCL